MSSLFKCFAIVVMYTSISSAQIQWQTCTEGSALLYECVTISGMLTDFEGRDFNGLWQPISSSSCWDRGTYVYQKENNALPGIYLCNYSNGVHWTFTDTVCDFTDTHKKAYCDRTFDNIRQCQGYTNKGWLVQTQSGIYSQSTSAQLDTCPAPTYAPTSSPSNPSNAPTTAFPTTSPITPDPTTANPTSQAPTTAAPTTDSPTTSIPTTQTPTTSTSRPTTSDPTSAAPTTAAPTANEAEIGTLQPTPADSDKQDQDEDENGNENGNALTFANDGEMQMKLVIILLLVATICCACIVAMICVYRSRHKRAKHVQNEQQEQEGSAKPTSNVAHFSVSSISAPSMNSSQSNANSPRVPVAAYQPPPAQMSAQNTSQKVQKGASEALYDRHVTGNIYQPPAAQMYDHNKIAAFELAGVSQNNAVDEGVAAHFQVPAVVAMVEFNGGGIQTAGMELEDSDDEESEEEMNAAATTTGYGHDFKAHSNELEIGMDMQPQHVQDEYPDFEVAGSENSVGHDAVYTRGDEK